MGQPEAAAEPEQDVVQAEPGEPGAVDGVVDGLLEGVERVPVGRELAVDDGLDAAVGLLPVGDELPPRGAVGERDQIRVAVVQRRGDVLGVRLLPDLAEESADGARLGEEGELVVGELPEGAAGGALDDGVGEGADLRGRCRGGRPSSPGRGGRAGPRR